jgi:hypothetical protein
MKKLYGLLLAILLAGAGQTTAQKLTFDKQLKVSVFNESTALPFIRSQWGDLHPGIQIATSWTHKQKGEVTTFVEAQLSGYHHKFFQNALTLSGAYGLRYTILGGLSAEVAAGLGYMHQWSDNPTFEPVEGGGFEQKRDWGRPEAMINSHIGLNYVTNGITIFGRYQWFAEAPFAYKNGVPLFSHTAVHIGIGFNI